MNPPDYVWLGKTLGLYAGLYLTEVAVITVYRLLITAAPVTSDEVLEGVGGFLVILGLFIALPSVIVTIAAFIAVHRWTWHDLKPFYTLFMGLPSGTLIVINDLLVPALVLVMQLAFALTRRDPRATRRDIV